jgi:rod shape determining protein RodA
MIALQPDLGTAILIASSGFIVIFFAGISYKLLMFMATFGILSCPLMWFILHDYQRSRILTLINPERDPLGAGYHIIQSKIALGSGGLYGRGWLQGSQSQLEYLPERSTDFIFAVFGEEFGLIGIAILVSLYLLVIIRGLYIALQGKDTFCRLWAAGIIMMFFICLFVNMAMVNGLLPVVGVPLPLISYGGTSMLTMMIGFGMLMSIWKHRRFIDGKSF